MADTPTDEYGYRQQSLGSNTNTWGDDKLNEVIRAIAQTIGGVKQIALTGDYTITSTNYVTTADNKNAVHWFTGALSSAVTVTYPSAEAVYLIYNASGAAITAQCSGGSGVTIPNGFMSFVHCDATDIRSRPLAVNGALNVSGIVSGVSAAVAGTDAPNLTQVNALIASGAIPGAPGTVKVDAAAASVYLGAALTASGDVTLTDNGDSIDIGVTVDTEPTEALGGKLTDTFTTGTNATVANRRYRISGTATATLPTMAAGDFVIIEFAVGAGITGTVGRNSQTIDGASEDDTYIGTGGSGPVLLYSCVSVGVVTTTLIGSAP